MFISPMLAQKADQPYDDEQIIAEPKMDGFRLILTTTHKNRRGAGSIFHVWPFVIIRVFSELYKPVLPIDLQID